MYQKYQIMALHFTYMFYEIQKIENSLACSVLDIKKKESLIK